MVNLWWYARIIAVSSAHKLLGRVTTCLENLEMSGHLTAVREYFTENNGNVIVRELSGKQSCHGKVA